jgi:hypothetical protein
MRCGWPSQSSRRTAVMKGNASNERSRNETQSHHHRDHRHGRGRRIARMFGAPRHRASAQCQPQALSRGASEVERVKGYYKAIGSLYPVLRAIFPNQVSTMREVALAVINSALKCYPKTSLGSEGHRASSQRQASVAMFDLSELNAATRGKMARPSRRSSLSRTELFESKVLSRHAVNLRERCPVFARFASS